MFDELLNLVGITVIIGCIAIYFFPDETLKAINYIEETYSEPYKT